MSQQHTLKIKDFTYTLPEERIALYPLPRRDHSKLLVYRDGKIEHHPFLSLSDHLPLDSLLFFNNTKVIPARLRFKKDTGATIEIFLLHPVFPSPLLTQTMAALEVCRWECAIGNLKRWASGTHLQLDLNGVRLQAVLTNRDQSIVEFRWNNGQSFAEVLQVAGETPLPPYIKRKAEVTDQDRYQTIYSRFDGAVAAPTAGLHFTEDVLAKLRLKEIKLDYLTLHVSAGTFQPVKSENADEHTMHEEQIVVTRENLENMLTREKFIVAVGTTSMRTLESVYWYGAKLLSDPESEFNIGQQDAYTLPAPSRDEAIQAVLRVMDKKESDHLTGETSIYIKPGYAFKICQGLITNFHQPGSTLLLLVAAFVGNDWRKVYEEALKNDYRFLSYGDSSLLLPNDLPQRH
jgi:S-adenosylmethionine:tRNA ribosyltransferase-isomerase